MATIYILLCLFSLVCYRFFFKKPKEAHGYVLPPSPPSLPIIGHLHLLLSAQAYKAFYKISSKFGPLLLLRVFNVPFVLVSSASMAYEIYKTHDVNNPSHGTPGIDESLLSGSSSFAMAPYGAYWKFTKKLMVKTLLGPQALERSRDIRAKELARFHSNLLDKAMKKESVELGEEAMKYIHNTICRMSMGRSFSEENGEAERARGLVTEGFGLFKKITLGVALRKHLEKFGITLFKKEIMTVSNKFDELLERIIREHEEKPDENQSMDMVDALVAAYHDKNAEYKLTRKEMKSFLVDLMLGGTDTSSQAIQWTMAEILSNPNVLEKLREEIDSVVGNTRMVQETDVPNLPYLQATIKEGLRLHPSFPFTARVLDEGCMIKGFYIPPKTPFFMSAYAVMRDPEYWENPDEFKPERFLTSTQENERKEEAIKYIPFGGGRRACPASSMALSSLVTTVGMMVQRFDWRIEGEKKDYMKEASGLLTMNMARPLKCTLVPRS